MGGRIRGDRAGPCMQKGREESDVPGSVQGEFSPRTTQGSLSQYACTHLARSSQRRLAVGKTMWAVCDCFGIHNASGKIIGRNNPHAVIPAIFSALLKYRPLDHVTLGRGRRLYDIRDAAPRYMM